MKTLSDNELKNISGGLRAGWSTADFVATGIIVGMIFGAVAAAFEDAKHRPYDMPGICLLIGELAGAAAGASIGFIASVFYALPKRRYR